MGILSQAEIDDIVSDISEIITDDLISTTIQYQLAGTTVSTWNPTTATIPSMYATTSVSAFLGSYTLQEIEQSGGLIEFGDRPVIMMSSAVSGILSTDDRMITSATTYTSAVTHQIINISRDPLDICYFFQIRSV